MESHEFCHIYTNLPIGERSQVIVVLNDEPYSWRVVYGMVKYQPNSKMTKDMLDFIGKILKKKEDEK